MTHPRVALGTLRRIVGSGSFRGAATFAFGGIGFSLGNIVLAGALAPAQFGLFSLILALMQFGLSCGSMGMDVVVKRHRPRVTPTLFWRVTLNAVVTMALITWAAGIAYGLSPGLLPYLFLGGTLAAINNIVVGIHQSRARLGLALFLSQWPNAVILLLAIVAQAGLTSAALPLLGGVVAGYLSANLVGWWQSLRNQSTCAPLDWSVATRESLASFSIGLALQLLWQFERIAIPKLLSLDDLATYAVLAAIVAAPFRATQIGIAFTLVERLRNAPNATDAARVLRHELLVALLITSVAVAGVLLAAPLVLHYYLHDKYVVGTSLTLATVAVGMARVAEGFTTTAVTALGTTRDLAHLSAMSWLGLLLAIAAAILLRGFGLTGILGGSLLGWLTLSAAGGIIASRSFKLRFGN
jgi:O-antigen/teichoic acid export membrane protein